MVPHAFCFDYWSPEQGPVFTAVYWWTVTCERSLCSLLSCHPSLIVCWSSEWWHVFTSVYWCCFLLNSHGIHFCYLILIWLSVGHQTHGMGWQQFIGDVYTWTAMMFTSITSSQLVVTRPMACVDSTLLLMFTYEQPWRSLLSLHPNLWSPDPWHVFTAVYRWCSHMNSHNVHFCHLIPIWLSVGHQNSVT